MRRQLPGHSPLTLGGLARACVAVARSPSRPAEELRSVLMREFGADEAVLLDSGTHALQVALQVALDEAPQGAHRVALPAYSCFDVATAAVAVGAPVVLYDVDPTTLTPDLSSLSRAMSAGVGAVVAGNLYGFPLDWRAIRAVAGEALLIEDAAQGLGSEWEGRPSGTFGDLTVLSFGRGKGWTGGGGGSLLARGLGAQVLAALSKANPPAASRRGLRAGAAALAQWLFGRPWLYGVPASIPALGLGETRYKHPSDPRPIPPFAAAALAAHRSAAEAESRTRQALAGEWLARIESCCADRGTPVCRPVPGGRASYLRFPLLAADKRGAEALVSLGRRWGLERGYPLALADLPALGPLLEGKGALLPGAHRLAACLLTLPCHSRVRERDMDRIAALL